MTSMHHDTKTGHSYDRFRTAKELLTELKFDLFKQDFPSFIAHGIEMLNRAKHGEDGPKCAYDPSGLSQVRMQLEREASFLIVDVGGSHTRATLVNFNPGGTHDWKVLCDLDNGEIVRAAKVEGFAPFTKTLAEITTNKFRDSGVELEKIEGIGMVWSNALRGKRLTGAVSGVDGEATGITEKSAYQKGEKFLKGLKDGDLLGKPFLEAFEARGLKPKVFVLGNDTIFTLAATPGADAGMVASTGANCTAVADDGNIYNTEFGAHFKVPTDCLTSADIVTVDRYQDGELERRLCQPTLEGLLAGKWLPELLENYVLTFAKQGAQQLQPLAERISEARSQGKVTLLGGKDFSALVNRNSESTPLVTELTEQKALGAEAIQALREIGAALIERGGMAAAGMAYFSLYDALRRKNEVTLSLDSSQARLNDGYQEIMESTLRELIGAKATLHFELREEILIDRGGDKEKISVPTQGLAEFLASELAAKEQTSKLG
ncbi:MAG: hypothetical protein GX589_07730 [Deltaproteobacteria bacterium]|nr:hypothetical protein [Deltaproteobacteria bacterium]